MNGRVRRDTRGGIGIMAAFAMPLTIGFTALAVDVGSATLESRKLQGIADAAALAAASDPARAQALAESYVATAGWPRAMTVRATQGSYARDTTVAPANRFTVGAMAADAVRVSLESPSPTFFAAIFGRRSITIGRHATAARERFAAFSIGSRLASLNGGIVNGYLSALTGSSVSLSVMDYSALIGADVDLFGYLDALRTTASLRAVTYDETVASTVTLPQALSALASVYDAQGNGTAAGAVRKLAVNAPSQSIDLSALIDPGKIGQQGSGGRDLARVDGMALATALLQLASGARQVSFDAAAGIPGLATTRLTIAIGERPAQSPWITITDTGMPIVRTAQARVYAETKLLGTSLPGLGAVAEIRLPVFVELAAGEARLTGIDCATPATRRVTIDARTNPGTAAIASIDTTRFQDFQTPLTLGSVRIADTLLAYVDGKAVVSLGAAEPWHPLVFDAAAVAAGTPITVASSTPVSGLAESLVHNLALSARLRLLGLPIPLDPLASVLGTQLGLVSPAIDSLLAFATGTLGVGIGEADVRVTGMRCGNPVLVA